MHFELVLSQPVLERLDPVSVSLEPVGLGEEGWRQKRLDAVKQVTKMIGKSSTLPFATCSRHSATPTLAF